MRHAAIGLLGLLATAAQAEGSHTATAVEVKPKAPPLAGLYRYVGDAAEEAARKEAIDRGIESLFFAIRPIARSRADGATVIAATYSISFEGALIRVRAPDRPDYVSPADGREALYRYKGDESTLTHRVQGRTLIEHFDQEGEGRINEYTLDPDDQRLKVKVTLYSPKLTRPIVYVLSYRRDERARADPSPRAP